MNRSIIWIILILIGIGFQAEAQEWQRKLDGPNLPQLLWTGSEFSGHDVQQTTDGNFVMAGVQSYFTGAIRDYPSLVKVNAQGFTIWQKSYFSDNADVAWFSQVSLVEMATGDLLLAGLAQGTIHLIKTNSVGDTLSTTSYISDISCPTCQRDYLKLRATFDGNYILSLGIRDVSVAPSIEKTKLIKITPNGTVLWEKLHHHVMAKDVQPTMDGGYIVSGWEDFIAQGEATVYKVDMNGDSVWSHKHPGIGAQMWMSMFHSITQTPDSGYVTVSRIQGGPFGTDFFPIIVKLDKTGANVLWSTQMAVQAGFDGEDGVALYVDYNPNGYLIVTGHRSFNSTWPTTTLPGPFVAKIDTNGAILEERDLGFGIMSSYNSTNTVRPTTDGGYIMVGSSAGVADLVKVDSAFRIPSHNFYGSVYRDNNLDCNKDSSEVNLSGWIIEATENTTGIISYATTNSLGYYSMGLDTGTFTLKAIPINSLWTICVSSISIASTSVNNVDTLSFGAQPVTSCPLLQVDISTPLLRRCVSNIYTVSYCNNGTIDEANTYIEVDLDTSLQVTGASTPFTGPVAGVYTFNVGNVGSGFCGSFTIDATVSCFSLLGETHCVEAYIYPDSTCVTPSPLWDRSDIDVKGFCYGDSIEFTIKNVGVGDMAVTRQFFVTEDHVILMVDPFLLNAGDSVIKVVHTTGATYRLQAEQDPFHPYNTYAAVGVQMCMNASLTPGFFGVLVQYEEDDGSPFQSIDCQQNVGSWDPNDKKASPVGYGTNHYIEQNTDLEYHIRFQNTGTDTAFDVVVWDTLSSLLDPSSIIPGASSDPYTWELTSTGVLVFNFDNIMLPDSNSNEVASHGFVKFRIKQDLMNPLGSMINNSAAILFDMNVPVLTNTTFHEVGEDFIVVSVETIGNRPSTTINVFPNPFQEQARIEVEGETFNKLEVHVVDAMGREVQFQQVQFEQQIDIYRQNLTTGVYFFQLIGDGELIGTGKIIVQ
jgi:hypothetical protein